MNKGDFSMKFHMCGFFYKQIMASARAILDTTNSNHNGICTRTIRVEGKPNNKITFTVLNSWGAVHHQISFPSGSIIQNSGNLMGITNKVDEFVVYMEPPKYYNIPDSCQVDWTIENNFVFIKYLDGYGMACSPLTFDHANYPDIETLMDSSTDEYNTIGGGSHNDDAKLEYHYDSTKVKAILTGMNGILNFYRPPCPDSKNPMLVECLNKYKGDTMVSRGLLFPMRIVL